MSTGAFTIGNVFALAISITSNLSKGLAFLILPSISTDFEQDTTEIATPSHTKILFITDIFLAKIIINMINSY